MAVTWNIVSVDKKTIGSLSDVVLVIHWYAQDKETIGTGESAVDHCGSQYGCEIIAEPDSSSFIEYKDLTEEKLLEWVKAVMGAEEVTQVETNIATRIAESKSPTVTSGLPW
tara:strand:- start:191 stop:526 length:336 start_codon:yes stop_codon:yes gene_type:complete